MKKLIAALASASIMLSAAAVPTYAAEQVCAITEAMAGVHDDEYKIETGIDGVSFAVGADTWTYSKDSAGGANFTGRMAGKANANIAAKTGTYYAISIADGKPEGKLSVTYQLGGGKNLVVMDGETELYMSEAPAAKITDTYSFTALANHTYYVYAAGSKLGFYGFTYKTVDKQADFAEEIAKIGFDVIKGENTDINAVESDLNLIQAYESQFGSCDVKWESTDRAVIDIDGNVNCQKTETKVTVTGIFSVQEDDSLVQRKSFDITVIADPDDESAVKAAADALTIGDTSALKSDITLPTAGKRGTSIAWASSDEGVITKDGAVTRANRADKSAVLTATISRGDASVTKDFAVTVSGYVPVTVSAYSYADANGKACYTPVDGGMLKSVYVKRELPEVSDNDLLIAMVYDKDGRLKGVKSVKLGDMVADTDESVEIGLAMDASDSFKLAALDMDGLEDYMDVFTANDGLKDGAKLYVVGDSTAAVYDDNNYPRKGWAQMLGSYFDGVEVVDLALSGRSSLNFKGEANYQKLKNELRAGDYLIVQFGHNDSKADDPTRYTDPKGDRFTEGSFKYSMNEYVQLAREKGAHPIIATSISRLKLSDTSLEEYVNAAKELAAEVNAPCIDLYARTNAWINEVGTETGKDMFNHVKAKDSRFIDYPNFNKSGFYAAGTTDNTHLNIYGADIIAQWAAEELKAMGVAVSQKASDYKAVFPLPSYAEATTAE